MRTTAQPGWMFAKNCEWQVNSGIQRKVPLMTSSCQGSAASGGSLITAVVFALSMWCLPTQQRRLEGWLTFCDLFQPGHIPCKHGHLKWNNNKSKQTNTYSPRLPLTTTAPHNSRGNAASENSWWTECEVILVICYNYRLSLVSVKYNKQMDVCCFA